MERLKLSVQPRKIVGKKVKKLRREGLIPGNVFGRDIKSQAIQIEGKEFQKTFKEAGETALIDVKVGEEVFPSLIHATQRDPRYDVVIHVDFHKVNLKEKITTHVPIVLVGESLAEKAGTGLILQTLNEVEVECLPTDIPSEINVDISKLEEVGQNVHVKGLKIDKEKIEVKNEPEELVVSVQTAEMKEVVEEVPVSPEDVEATAEKGEEIEGVEGTEEKDETKEEKAEV